MISEQFMQKIVIFITSGIVSLGLVLKSFLLIQIGILPSITFVIYWALKQQKQMKLGIGTKSLKNKEN